MNRSRRAGWALACLGLAAALALPPIARERTLPNVLAIVDITQSMNVMDAMLDGQPVSRLALVKQKLQQAVVRLPCGSRLGLGVFTQYRSVVLVLPVETCANRRELTDTIAGIDGRMAWAGGSEIAKGVYLTLRMLKPLDEPPALVFITDGHEAPPINPRHRIDLAGEGAVIPGIILGVGGRRPMPIPKVDPEGNPAGFWGPDEVMQHDVYAQGRQGTESNESMDESAPAAPVEPALEGTPGQEHLSFLHEPYLKIIAAEAKLDYARLAPDTDLARVLRDPKLSRKRPVTVDWRWMLGALALAGMVVPYGLAAVKLEAYKATASIWSSVRAAETWFMMALSRSFHR